MWQPLIVLWKFGWLLLNEPEDGVFGACGLMHLIWAKGLFNIWVLLSWAEQCGVLREWKFFLPFSTSATPNTSQNNCMHVLNHLRVDLKYPLYAASESAFYILFSFLRKFFSWLPPFSSPRCINVFALEERKYAFFKCFCLLSWVLVLSTHFSKEFLYCLP